MAPTSKAPSRSTRVQKRNPAGMHLPATLPRPQRQPRPSNARPHSALFSATASRPGRGAVRLECGGLPPLFFHPQPEPAQIQASSPPSVTSGVVNLTAYFQNGWLAIAPDAFSYGPQILQLLPNAGTNTGGDSVQIYGYGFGSDPTKITVKIGGANAAVQKVENVTTIASSLSLDSSYPFSLERITLLTPP